MVSMIHSILSNVFITLFRETSGLTKQSVLWTRDEAVQTGRHAVLNECDISTVQQARAFIEISSMIHIDRVVVKDLRACHGPDNCLTRMSSTS